MERLIVARKWGTTPLTMLGSPLASKDWSEADRLLAHALEIDQVLSRCPCGCGGYADQTLKSDGWHEVETVRCDAKAELDEHHKNNKPEPGEIAFPVYVGD